MLSRFTKHRIILGFVYFLAGSAKGFETKKMIAETKKEVRPAAEISPGDLKVAA